MGSTQINQIPYPTDSDDSDITYVKTMIDACDDLLCPSIPRTSLSTRYASPDTGAVVHASGDNRLDLYKSSKWVTGSYKYAPLRNQDYVYSTGASYLNVPGAYFPVYSGERYKFHGELVFATYIGSDRFEFAWDTPAMTYSSWNVRCTGLLTAKTAQTMATSKVVENNKVEYRIQGSFQPSADGNIQFKFKKETDTEYDRPQLIIKWSYIALARIA